MKPPVWNEFIEPFRSEENVEVGVFGKGDEPDAEELSLGGLLAVVGESDHLGVFYMSSEFNAYPGLTKVQNQRFSHFLHDIIHFHLRHSLAPSNRRLVSILS